MKIVNLTPHPLTIICATGATVSIPKSSLPPARLAVSRDELAAISLEDGESIPVSRPKMGAIQDLPAPAEGVVYVVSALVAAEAKRPDVLSPGEAVRDTDGNIIGARGLCSY